MPFCWFCNDAAEIVPLCRVYPFILSPQYLVPGDKIPRGILSPGTLVKVWHEMLFFVLFLKSVSSRSTHGYRRLHENQKSIPKFLSGKKLFKNVTIQISKFIPKLKKISSYGVMLNFLCFFILFNAVKTLTKLTGERGGSVVECRTPVREVGGSKPTAAVLCPWARHFTPRKYWIISQEAVAPSRHDWKIVDWDVKPQHKQTKLTLHHMGKFFIR